VSAIVRMTEPAIVVEAVETTSTTSFTDESEYNRTWSRPEILLLISLYESHRHLFKSSTMKNEKVWKLISESLKTHTPSQCENKFKYLKSGYIKKVENMGPKKTGEPPVKFEYFTELDTLFGKDHRVKPVKIASTMAGCSPRIAGCSSLKEDEMETEKVLKSKKRKLECKESLRQKRHEDSMEFKRQALDTFKH
jgi:hypothetical protein